MSGDLKGYSHPLSPEGRASLVGAPPWHYSGRILYFSYKTNAAEIRKWLPAPLELGPDPELASVMFCDWASFPTSDPEYGARYPERSQYREVLLQVGCSLNGRPGQRCVAAWVDNDFTLARGWFQGFPKKLGRVSIARPAEASDLDRCHLRTNGLIAGTCEAGGQRVVAGTLRVKNEITPEDLPPLMKRPMYLTRHFPGVQPSEPPAVHEIITLASDNVVFGRIVKGDAELNFSECFFEEHMSLKPREMLAGYHISMGYTVKGGKVLFKYESKAGEART